MPSAKVKTVDKRGAPAGSRLCGVGPFNRGLVLEVEAAQERGHTGWVRGAFKVLEAGGRHEPHLRRFMDGKAYTADLIIREIAPQTGARTFLIFNCTVLKVCEENQPENGNHGRL